MKSLLDTLNVYTLKCLTQADTSMSDIIWLHRLICDWFVIQPPVIGIDVLPCIVQYIYNNAHITIIYNNNMYNNNKHNIINNIIMTQYKHKQL